MDTHESHKNNDDLKTALSQHFTKWRESIGDQDLKEKFIVDGALPGYFGQKLRILFIGRETQTTENLKEHPEERNIVEFVDSFLSGRIEDNPDPSSEAYAVRQILKEGNVLHCWRLAARIAYSVLYAEPWENLEELWTKPSFEELQNAYNRNEYSFAIVAISKYNAVESKSKPGVSDRFKDGVDQGLGMKKDASTENFIREEIEILSPDLIISWNVKSLISKKRFNKLLTEDPKRDPQKISCNFLPDRAWSYELGEKQIPFLDTWHFSVDPRKKNRQLELFNPVMEAIRHLIENGDIKPNILESQS